MKDRQFLGRVHLYLYSISWYIHNLYFISHPRILCYCLYREGCIMIFWIWLLEDIQAISFLILRYGYSTSLVYISYCLRISITCWLLWVSRFLFFNCMGFVLFVCTNRCIRSSTRVGFIIWMYVLSLRLIWVFDGIVSMILGSIMLNVVLELVNEILCIFNALWFVLTNKVGVRWSGVVYLWSLESRFSWFYLGKTIYCHYHLALLKIPWLIWFKYDLILSLLFMGLSLF